MKILEVKRKTAYEKRYSLKMGELTTRVTYIKRYVFGVPVKTLHKYRETYYGQVKDCNDCTLFI
jgi:negative regulator of genetic competence, sporulation and motility